MKDYIKGIVGGLIGGLIASIPWVLVYVFGNMLLSLLAMVIALGASFGYKKIGGKMNNAYPISVAVLSVLIVIVVMTVVIPLALIANEGFDASWYNFSLLYSNQEFVSALAKDTAVALLFTALGIAGVVKQAKMETIPKEEV